MRVRIYNHGPRDARIQPWKDAGDILLTTGRIVHLSVAAESAGTEPLVCLARELERVWRIDHTLLSWTSDLDGPGEKVFFCSYRGLANRLHVAGGILKELQTNLF